MTTIATSERRMLALQRANEIRSARAMLLHRMRMMEVDESHRFAADLIEDVPDVLRTLSVGALLDRVRRREPNAGRGYRRVGKAGQPRAAEAERMMAAAGVGGPLPLGDLTPRQRAALVGALRFRGGA